MDAARKVESTGKEARAAKDSGKKDKPKCKTCGKRHMGVCRKATLECLSCGKRHMGVCRKATLECFSCGKRHMGVCRKATLECFSCGKTDHYKRDCPKLQQGLRGAQAQGAATAAAATTQQSRVSTSGCFLCGDTGHCKMDCPNLQQNPNGAQALPTTAITTQVGRDADKATVQVGREQPRLYALTQQDAEASNALVAGESHHLESSGIEYAEFEEKVRRTVYIDSFSPLATEAVVKAALDQFGNVIQVKFIHNYLESGQAALVELDNAEQVEKIISEVNDTPFMICGMPRPVRARAAEAEMFDDRPRKPGRRIVCRWLDSKDPDFEVAKRIKLMVRNQAEEAKFVLKCQLEEEEKLAKRQSETLNATYKKYELIESVVTNRVATRLAECYRVRVADFEH